MVISNEKSEPILIDSITSPICVDYFWTLNLENRDFELSPLEMLEEHTTPTLVVQILGYLLEIPASWNILIYSQDTSQLDIAEASEICRGNFSAFLFNNKTDRHTNGSIRVIDYLPKSQIYVPSLNKTQMLCHHIGKDYWACISPTDNYNKYLKDAVVGDIIP